MQIYINRDGQQFGPYSLAQARDYLESGNLVPEDLAWYDEDIDWVPLGEIPGMTGPVATPEPVRSATPEWVPPRRDTTAVTSLGRPAPSLQNSTPTKTFTAPEPPIPTPHPAVDPGAPTPPVQRIVPPRAGDPFRRAARARAVKNLTVGGLFCGGGTAVTAYSYMAAAHSPHGTFILAWGAILFGGSQFVLGAFQYFKGEW